MLSQIEARTERMYINPANLSIAILLGGAMTFEVPRYQRNYSWVQEEIATFLRDLEVCVKAREDGARRH